MSVVTVVVPSLLCKEYNLTWLKSSVKKHTSTANIYL